MLTILDIANDSDSHVLYANSGRTAKQTAYLVNSINAGLEDMRAMSPQSFRATVELTWTAGVPLTTTVSGASLGPSATFANYTAGCTLNVDGDATYNELATVGDGATISTAIFPYSGTAGSHSMTIWGDCVKLGATVDRVMGGMLLHERRALDILGSRAEWLAYQRATGASLYDYGSLNVQPTVIRRPGVPRGIWLETVLNGNAIEYRARCSPLPNADYRATIDVQTMPENITADDLSDGAVTVTGTLSPDVTGRYLPTGKAPDGTILYVRSATDTAGTSYLWFETNAGTWFLGNFAESGGWVGPGAGSPAGSYTPSSPFTGTATITGPSAAATTRPVPGHRDYNILRALCLYHWSGSPWFRNDAARQVILQGYQNAVDQLKGFRPNAAETPVSRVCY